MEKEYEPKSIQRKNYCVVCGKEIPVESPYWYCKNCADKWGMNKSKKG